MLEFSSAPTNARGWRAACIRGVRVWRRSARFTRVGCFRARGWRAACAEGKIHIGALGDLNELLFRAGYTWTVRQAQRIPQGAMV